MPSNRIDTTPVEALVVVLICFGYFIVLSSEMAARGLPIRFGDAELVWGMFFEIFAAAIALTFLQARGYAVATLQPVPTISGVGAALVLLFLAYGAAQLVVIPFGVSAENQPIAQAIGQADAALATVVVTAIVNGTFEEVFLLGFLLRGLRRYGVAVALGMSLLVRALFHTYQGVYGMLAVLVFGLVLSGYYLRTQALFPVTFAHILADIVPFTGLAEWFG